MNKEIKCTIDGSCTLYVPELKEHYHSINGAVQESQHVFIRSGLNQATKETVNLLEVGFGTGLNTLLTFVHRQNRTIEYHAMEPFPLEYEIIRQLNYPKYLDSGDLESPFDEIHKSIWNEPVQISSSFVLTKIKASIINYKFDRQYDLIYFDAFAPDVQPELWEESVFTRLCKTMNQKGILVTYCAKGEVRRRMQRSGFEVERLPGPPGKREILRALKP